MPVEEDIGRCLKLEVRVLLVATADQPQQLVFTRVADTEPVLSAPPMPPKRLMANVKVRDRPVEGGLTD